MPRKRISVLFLILSLSTFSLTSYGEDETVLSPIDTAILNYLAPRGETQVGLYYTGGGAFVVGAFGTLLAGLHFGQVEVSNAWRKRLSRHLFTTAALSLSSGIGFLSLADGNPGGVDVTQYRDRLKAFRNTEGYRELQKLYGEDRVNDLIMDVFTNWSLKKLIRKYVRGSEKLNEIQTTLSEERKTFKQILAPYLWKNNALEEAVDFIVTERTFHRILAARSTPARQKEIEAFLEEKKNKLIRDLSKINQPRLQQGPAAHSIVTGRPVATPPTKNPRESTVQEIIGKNSR